MKKNQALVVVDVNVFGEELPVRRNELFRL